MNYTLFVSSKTRTVLRKLWAGFLMLSINLSLSGVGVIFATANVAEAATPIFTSGFESSTFGDWNSDEGRWHNDATDARTGGKSARVTDDTGSNPDWIIKKISTSGYSNLQRLCCMNN